MLESVVADRPPGRLRSAALGAVYAVLPITVVMTIVVWFTDRGGYRIVVAVIAAAAVLAFCYNASRPTIALRAGARVVKEVDADDAGVDLPLYELRTITITDTWRGRALRIVGPNKQPLRLPLGLLEANQQLWDLVYNGIRHSEAAGATIDEHTRQALNLPSRAPELNT